MNLHIERREREGIDSAGPETRRFEMARDAVYGFVPARTARRFHIFNRVQHQDTRNAGHGAGRAATC